MKQGYVYIMTNPKNTVLYTGVTNNLIRRAFEHREKLNKCFTSRYNVVKLVWYEYHSEIISAIAREKQLKGGSRAKKLALVEAMNSEWVDPYDLLLK